MSFEVEEEYLKNSMKQGFFDISFLNFDDFSKFVPFRGNLSAKTQQFYM